MVGWGVCTSVYVVKQGNGPARDLAGPLSEVGTVPFLCSKQSLGQDPLSLHRQRPAPHDTISHEFFRTIGK